MIDASSHFSADPDAAFSQMALGMVPSRILVIAYAVRDRIAAGERVVQFTVGDFAPSEFQTPEPLKAAIVDAVQANQTNYPPAHGMPQLRDAIQAHYRRHLGSTIRSSRSWSRLGLGRPSTRPTAACWTRARSCSRPRRAGTTTTSRIWSRQARRRALATRRQLHAHGRGPGAPYPRRPAAGLVLADEPHRHDDAGPQLKAICELILAENARRKRPASDCSTSSTTTSTGC